ncbi:MAG: Ser-tRNA(Thr) hydrolase / threonyl-tRNA synthetase [Magnetococcales bacterium]|nr:Ser-tRNA(Thr) hydrolase / threonyl-tRNA synthetase [Magnetococcales bacterium]HIJ82723.1 threonine--tRNA ligase [Magnetococcales bacterium]
MFEVTLPDGTGRRFDQPVTVGEVAAAIGPGLAKAAIAGRVDGRMVDLGTRIDRDCQVAIITMQSPEGLEIIRHSTSHLMAQAVKELFPGAQVTIGPAVENGFYYDFDYERPFTTDDLGAIEEKMRQISDRNETIGRREMARDEALALFKGMGEHYKGEIIGAIDAGQTLSLYSQGDFVDLCRGPHVPSTGYLKAFKLLSVAGAYWRGNAANKQLQRIYGTAWADAKSLKSYLHMLEESEKRDHRRLGRELDLFSIQEAAGGGLVFWHPMGSRVRQAIEGYWKETHIAAGYEFLYTPHMANLELWRTSGHLDFYHDSMFNPMHVDEQEYQIRPMNCPFHILVYQSKMHSHRDFPIRWAELGTVYRYELSGALHGLFRVRGFTQDDAHIFCREEQIEDEITAILDLTLAMLGTFGFKEFDIFLSTRPEKSVGSTEIWDQATGALVNAIKKHHLDFVEDKGGGAFYGPKIDVKITDCLGRKWQCSTIQLDFNLPERFDITYIGEDGGKHRPIMIHRALMGSLERFFGILVEHYAGRFPLWLAPVQAVVLTITDASRPWAVEVRDRLRAAGLRAEADLRNEKIGYKIREHTLKKVPWLLIVGDREQEQRAVSPRDASGKDLGLQSLDSLVEKLVLHARERRT